MEYVAKLTAVCTISVCITLLFKKNQPELSFVLGTCTAIFVLYCTISLYQQISDRLDRWESMLSLPVEYFVPLVKCLGISMVSQLGVNLCKDAGQAAVASGLEICGNMAAIWCILPLIEHLFSFIGEIL